MQTHTACLIKKTDLNRSTSACAFKIAFGRLSGLGETPPKQGEPHVHKTSLYGS